MDISLKWTSSAGPKGAKAKTGGSRGRVQGIWTPLIRPDTCLKLKFLHWQDCMSLLNCPIFLKLNTGCILPLNWIPGTFENVIILGYPPMIRCLSLQSSISGTNGDWRSQIEKHVVISVRSNLAQKSSTDRSEPKFGGANPAILDWGVETWQGVEPFYSNQASTHQSDHKCKEPSVNEEILASPLNDVQ